MGALDDIDSVIFHSVIIGVFENVNRPEAITCTILGSISSESRRARISFRHV